MTKDGIKKKHSKKLGVPFFIIILTSNLPNDYGIICRLKAVYFNGFNMRSNIADFTKKKKKMYFTNNLQLEIYDFVVGQYCNVKHLF